MIVNICGPDGAGKSTLSRALLEKAGDVFASVAIVSVDHILQSLSKNIPREAIQSHLVNLSPEARLLFISHGFLNAMQKLKVAKDGDHLIILDGYWMKYWAKELEIDEDFAQKLLRLLPKPDLHIFLKTDSDFRKESETQYERLHEVIGAQTIERRILAFAMREGLKYETLVAHQDLHTMSEKTLRWCQDVKSLFGRPNIMDRHHENLHSS